VRFHVSIAAILAVMVSWFINPVAAQAPEKRFAFVIGNSEYKAGRLPTAANDAGLIAETLRTAGFDVSGARDLDQDTLRRSAREFLDKIAAGGPNVVAVIYLAGYGVQYEGENYIVPIDAILRRNEDIPIESIRISDIARSLGGTPGTRKMLLVDAARQHPFTPAGTALASGLALVEPDANMLIAFNAAPGSIAPIENGPYGAFAQALAEMIGTGGLGLDDVFARLRLRVNDKNNGTEIPWYASKIEQPFLFLERAPGAPAPPQVVTLASLQSQPMRSFRGDQEAYVAALERDTLGGYEEFLAAFPDSRLALRVRAIVAVRREAITWRRTLNANTPNAYWSYLRRYPEGAHVADAQRRLAILSAAIEPPPTFAVLAYDVPPPPPDEVVYLNQPVVLFDGPGFAPPPPPPLFFLPPQPPLFVGLPPPPPPIGPFFLTAPGIAIGFAPFARPPAFVVAAPPPPMQQITINNTTIINQQSAGGAAPSAAALPAGLVQRVNSGTLQAPAPAAPPPAPIQTTALTGSGTLGQPTTLSPGPPRPTLATTAPPAATPGVAPPGPPRPPAPATATTAPASKPGVAPPGPPRPPVPATATTAPAATPGVAPPGPPRPPAPATAMTAPAAKPGVAPLGPPRPSAPATATTAPAAKPGVAPPGPPRPPAPAATPGVAPPGPPRPPVPAAVTPPSQTASSPPPAGNRPQAAGKPAAPPKKCVEQNGTQVCH
jgi:uncharacterized caspase-like protein